MITSRTRLQFLLNGEKYQLSDCPPYMTLLNWLRSIGLVGSKEGCAEGDCGACTVVLADTDPQDKDGKIRFQAVNACIRFMATLDGKAIYTVEGLAAAGDKAGETLHPVQQALVDHHGSQCGFCTPGFVMSLWAEYQNRGQNRGQNLPKPSIPELQITLNGNLCRCTGYRSILAAGQAAYDAPAQIIDGAKLAADLEGVKDDAILHLPHPSSNFMAPKSLADLVTLRQNHPAATILAGGTDIGLWVTKQHKKLPEIIYVGEVAELKTIEHGDNYLTIGAAVTLRDAFAAIEEYYPDIRELGLRFASTPICQSGTLVGNIANGSPIGDSMPPLIALKAEIELVNTNGRRRMNLDEFYLDYRKTALASDEIVAYLHLPAPPKTGDSKLLFAAYKISRRYDSDISAVCGGFAVWLNAAGMIEDASLAYGGVAAIPKRARLVEQALIDRPFDEATLKNAMTEFEAEFNPLSDLRAGRDYRLAMMRNLLWRFYLEKNPHNPLSPHETNVYAAFAATVTEGRA